MNGLHKLLKDVIDESGIKYETISTEAGYSPNWLSQVLAGTDKSPDIVKAIPKILTVLKNNNPKFSIEFLRKLSGDPTLEYWEEAARKFSKITEKLASIIGEIS